MGAANGKEREDFARATAVTREIVADMARARGNDAETDSASQVANRQYVGPTGETGLQTLHWCSRAIMNADLRTNRKSLWTARESPTASQSQRITTVTTTPSPLQPTPQVTEATEAAEVTEASTQTEWIDETQELTFAEIELSRAVFVWNAVQVQASALVLCLFWNADTSCELNALKYWIAAHTAYTALFSIVGGLTFWNRDQLDKHHPLLHTRLQTLCEILSSSNIVWFVVGNVLVYGRRDMCTHAPIYTLSVVLLAINYFQLSAVVLPVVIGVACSALYVVFACICLPCYCFFCQQNGRSRRKRVHSGTLEKVRKWLRPPTTDIWFPWASRSLFLHPVTVCFVYVMILGMLGGLCFCRARLAAFIQAKVSREFLTEFHRDFSQVDEYLEMVEARSQARQATRGTVMRV